MWIEFGNTSPIVSEKRSEVLRRTGHKKNGGRELPELEMNREDKRGAGMAAEENGLWMEELVFWLLRFFFFS